MSEEIQGPSELDTLKARADLMGIKYHPSIGLDKLKAKVNEEITSEDIVDTNIVTPILANKPTPLTVKESETKRNQRLRKESTRLVRVIVNCMNPNKREYEGEMFSVGNSIVGQLTKYVPYNNEEGWHIPFMLYEHLLERECQVFVTIKGPNGDKVRKGKMIKEFSITLMDSLTEIELGELATRQAMANNLG